jgi:hypothetical protein
MNSQPHSHGFRTKNILKIKRVKIAGIHFVIKLEEGITNSTKYIEPNIARVLHIRSVDSKISS